MFELHPRLAQDTFVIGDFPLCRLLLMNDASYPWFILVPRRAEIRELFQLKQDDQYQLLQESSQLAMVLSSIFMADKLNIASLGNIVPQLHIHHIVRYRSDQAWPQPVWGQFPAQPYSKRALQETCANLVERLQSFVPDAGCPLAPRVC